MSTEALKNYSGGKKIWPLGRELVGEGRGSERIMGKYGQSTLKV